jgi:CRP/FNR family transcriptional regulator, cyclic AMP receptor protein
VRLGGDKKVELIRDVPLFSHCSKKELAEVASLADEVDLPAGKEIIREGERGREFFVLLEGSADVIRGDRKIATLSSGDFAGEMALVSRQPRNATVETTTPVRALVITDQAFRSLMKRSDEIHLKVLEALAERLPPTTV